MSRQTRFMTFPANFPPHVHAQTVQKHFRISLPHPVTYGVMIDTGLFRCAVAGRPPPPPRRRAVPGWVSAAALDPAGAAGWGGVGRRGARDRSTARGAGEPTTGLADGRRVESISEQRAGRFRLAVCPSLSSVLALTLSMSARWAGRLRLSVCPSRSFVLASAMARSMSVGRLEV